MPFLENNGSALLLVAGIGVIIAILLRRSSRYWRKEKRRARNEKPISKIGRSPAAERREPLLDAPPEVVRWHVEMHEVARELKAEIDGKLVALQTLLGMVREETNRLEDALDRLDQMGGGTSQQIRAEIDEARHDDTAEPESLPDPLESPDDDTPSEK